VNPTNLTKLTIMHAMTKERRELKVDEITEKYVKLMWPLSGPMYFDTHQGRGIKKHAAWWLTPESLKQVHAETKQTHKNPFDKVP